MRTEHLAQRLVHQVRRRVVAHRPRARRVIDGRCDGIADLELAGLHRADVAEDIGLDLLRVVDGEQREARTALRELAAIADLAAGLRVERRLGEHDDTGLARGERVHCAAILVERGDATFVRQRLVAVEARLLAAVIELSACLELRRRARALALRVHRALEAGLVDLDAALAADVGGEIEREAEGVVERERGLAVEHLRVARKRLLEHPHSIFERLAEALLLLLRALAATRFCVAAQLRIRVAHHAVEVRHELVEERLLLPEL